MNVLAFIRNLLSGHRIFLKSIVLQIPRLAITSLNPRLPVADGHYKSGALHCQNRNQPTRCMLKKTQIMDGL